MSEHYAIVKSVASNYDDAIAAVKAALSTRGFGVLTEIDVAATLHKKLGVEFPRTIILGACNPKFAHQTLSAVPDISVFLPCNVVVRETPSGVEIAAIAPNLMAQVIANPEVTRIAAEVDTLIRAAIAEVA